LRNQSVSVWEEEAAAGRRLTFEQIVRWW
jgi:hypothetical protein